MSRDGMQCECGKPAFAALRVGGVREPVCAACLARVAGCTVPAVLGETGQSTARPA